MHTLTLLLLALSASAGTAAELPAQTPDPYAGVTLALFVLAAYLLPLLIALARRHHNALAIGVLNVLAGWTIVGYLVALVWSCTAHTKAQGAK